MTGETPKRDRMVDKSDLLQQQILNILIRYPSYLNSSETAIDVNDFDREYHPLLRGIYHAARRSSQLTEKSYIDFIKKSLVNEDYKKWLKKSDKDWLALKERPQRVYTKEKSIYYRVESISDASEHDFDVLVSELRSDKSIDKTNTAIDKFKKTASIDQMRAISDLSDDLRVISASGGSAKISMNFLDESFGEYLQSLKDSSEKENNNRIYSGIDAIDETMLNGLEEGSLTLIAADTGGFKSTTMLNMALNVYNNHKVNVLYCSLEMPESALMSQITSRETEIHREKLLKNPDTLTEKEYKKINEFNEKLQSNDHKFSIMDASDDRITIADIKKYIEEKVSFFKPRLVVIDYIGILKPEEWYANQPAHQWPGHQCKDIMQLGKKLGFASISAAQLGREALKRFRTQKESKQAVSSEDLRGSHELSTDAWFIYALLPHPNQTDQNLYLYPIKVRNGPKTFKNGDVKAVLHLEPQFAYVGNPKKAAWSDGSKEEYEIFEEMMRNHNQPNSSKDSIELNKSEKQKTNKTNKDSLDLDDDLDL